MSAEFEQSCAEQRWYEQIEHILRKIHTIQNLCKKQTCVILTLFCKKKKSRETTRRHSRSFLILQFPGSPHGKECKILDAYPSYLQDISFKTFAEKISEFLNHLLKLKSFFLHIWACCNSKVILQRKEKYIKMNFNQKIMIYFKQSIVKNYFFSKGGKDE